MPAVHTTPRERRQFKAALSLLALSVTVVVLWKVGVFQAAAGFFVHQTIDTMQAETERQANQPRVIILNSGKRIECKRVLDNGERLGFIRKDGVAGCVKKVEVKEVVEGAAAE